MSRGVPVALCLTALLLPQMVSEATSPPDGCHRLLLGSDQVAGDADLPVVFAAGTEVTAHLRSLFHQVHGKALCWVGLKNLLIHSARDLGLPGPDFTYGHGVVDAELAARIVRAAVLEDHLFGGPLGLSTRALPGPVETSGGGAIPAVWPRMVCLIAEGALAQGESMAFHIPVAPARELRATLVWHGPPAGVLVNDLDLRLEGPDGIVVLPWAPEPARPDEAAPRARNGRDDIEQARVAIPSLGWWRAIVEGHSVAVGPQPFSLILSVSRGNEPEPTLLTAAEAP